MIPIVTIFAVLSLFLLVIKFIHLNYKKLTNTQRLVKILSNQSSLPKSCRIANEANSLHTRENLFTP